MHKNTENRPIGGIDSDSENRLLATEDYRYALNISNSVGYENQFGVVTNIKGNVLIDNYTLPSGINKCIGSYYDRGENTTIYFVYNSQGQHKILRYYPSKTSNTYPYGTIQEIITFDFGWSDEEHITGIELVDAKLLYWTDSVKPRMINVVKGNITEKQKSWKVYLPKNYVQPFQSWGWNIYDMDGNQVFAGVFSFVGNLTREQAFEQIANDINASQNFLTAESCGCDLNVSETGTNQVYFDFAGNSNYKVVADNWYGLNLIDRFFDRGKWQPLIQPLAEYKKDDSFSFNYVDKKVFQFRIQYIYDNKEESAIGEWSLIPTNNIDCNENKTKLLNYIEVDFNNQDLLDANNFVILKKVSVYYRESNIGNERLIATLDVCDFYDGTKCYYNFYNNEISSAVSLELSNKQYDNIPIQSKALSYVKNRLIDANVKLNYDAPDCADIQITQTIEEKPVQKFYKVTAVVTIFTPSMADPGYVNDRYRAWATWQDAQRSANGNLVFMWPDNLTREPTIYQRNGLICHDTSRTENNFPFFGGAGYGQSPGADFGIRSGMEDEYDQRIPEGGWALYSAGNPFFGITKQGQYPLIQDAFGAFDTSQETLRKALGDYFYPTQNNFAKSTVEFFVPEGTHIFRLASHFCSFGDRLQLGSVYDLNNGIAWQQTSTNVWGVYEYDVNGNATWKGQQKEIVKTITEDTFLGEFVVADLAPNHSRDTENIPYTSFMGYLYDGNGRMDVNNQSWSGIPVENAVVTIEKYESFNVLGQQVLNNEYINGGFGITDHNGYFYLPGTTITALTDSFNIVAWSVSANPTDPNANGTIIKDRLFSVFKGDLGTLYGKIIQPLESKGENVINSLAKVILITDNENARKDCMTYVNGSIFDSDGYGVSDINVIASKGQWRRTDDNGYYKIPLWGDATTFFLQNGVLNWNFGLINANNNRLFSLVHNSPDGCDFETTISPEIINIEPYGRNTAISENTPPYSSTSIYKAQDRLLNYTNLGLYKARKRGGNYSIGIRFYDEMTRRCKIIPLQNVYVPYTTEDVGKYLSNYPLGTYRYGIPTISWQLGDFPQGLDWAYKYEIVWTKDETWAYSLQWICGAVRYVNKLQYQEDENTLDTLYTTYEASDATHLELSFDLVSYYRLYGSVFIDYSFEEGDVIRLLRDSNGDFYEGVYEFEIVSYSRTNQKITVRYKSVPFEIKSSTLFEILRPKKFAEDEEKIYYSSGELYYCTNPNTPNNDYSVKSGVFQSGDTYWRRRLLVSYNEITGDAKTYCYPLECKEISDFYPSESSDIGRPYIEETELSQAWYPTRMLISNIYDSTGEFNGLSEIEILSFNQLSLSFGEIVNLQNVRNVLLSIHSQAVVSNYVSQQMGADANGANGTLFLINDTIGNSNPLMQKWGCQNPESIVQWNGYVYGVDKRLRTVWRYSNDGLNAISDYKAKSFFNNRLSDATTLLGGFDEFKQEYVLTILGGRPAQTIAFFEPKNRWTTFYSFTPEAYGQSGNNIVSFVSGRIWLHDRSATYNNFYGVQAVSELWYIVNAENIAPKVWQAMYLEILNTANTNNWTIYEISNDNGQLSRIDKSSFVKKEAYWHSSFKRDLNTVAVSNPIINGRAMRSNMIVVKMRNDGSDLETLKGIVTAYQVSERITFY